MRQLHQENVGIPRSHALHNISQDFDEALAEKEGVSSHFLSCIKAVGLVWILCVCTSACIFELATSQSRENGQGIAILTFGTLISGSILLWQSKIPYLFPCPDVFVSPFMISIANSLQADLNGSQDFTTTFLVAMLFSSFLVGVCLMVGSRLEVYKIVGFFPYPILCSFVAGIGVIVSILSVVICHLEDNSSLLESCCMVAATSMIALMLAFYEMKGYSLAKVFPILFSVSIIVFYSFLLYFGISVEDAMQSNWLLNTPLQEYQVFSLFQAIAATPGTINWQAIMNAWCPMVALAASILIKCSLLLQDIEFELGRMVDYKYEMNLLGLATLGGSFGGATIPVPYLSLIQQLYFFSPNKRFLGWKLFCLACVLALVWVGPYAAAFVPRFIFSGFLLSRGLNLFYKWAVRVAKTARWADGVLIFSLLVSFVAFGFLVAVILGLATSVLLFVYHEQQIPIIRNEGSGLDWKSFVYRSKKERNWLDEYGDLIRILELQGVLFFGNSNSLYKHVEKMLEPNEDRSVRVPHFIVINIPMVLGIDASAVDALNRITRLAKKTKTNLLISGALPTVSNILKRDRNIVEKYELMPDLDQALARSEWLLLKTISSVHKQIILEAEEMKEIDPNEGFMFCLKAMQKRFGIKTAVLEHLAQYVTPITLHPGDILFPQAIGAKTEDGGLYFIEHGFITVQREPSQEIQGPYCLRNKEVLPKLVSFRIATISTGFCIGCVEFCSGGRRSLGVYRADTYCRVHFLPFSTIQMLESRKPNVILCLHKLMGCMISNAFDHVSDQLHHLSSRIYV